MKVIFRHKKIVITSIFWLMAMCVYPIAHADASTPEESVQTVEKSLAEMIGLFKDTELPQDEVVAKKLLLELLEENLNNVIDFQTIVKRIMGKHFSDASKPQRNRFLQVFKKNLVSSYGKFLLSADIQSLADKIQYKVHPTAKSRKAGRAEVIVTFKVEDKSYEVVHSMRYNKKRQAWVLENLVVEGVNLGINFRNQFGRMMTRNKNDYDKVIDEWEGADSQRLENGKG